MRKQRLWIAVLVLAVVITAVAGWLIYENRLDQVQQDALAELDRNAGQYDAQSIVLHSTSKAKAEKLAEQFGAKLRITKDGRFATLTLPDGVTIRDIYAQKQNRAYIDDMTADYHVQVSELVDEESGGRLPARPQYTVSDSDYELQTYLDYLNLGQVWNTNTGSGITVAVIDTGIDTDHPEFAGRISEYSYNASEEKIVKDFLLEDGSYDWSLIEDEQGHGTAVTGVIAASMNSGCVVGIAPDVEILVIKVACDENGTFTKTSDLVYGLYYAIERDVDIVNMSFGGYGATNPYAEATQLAVDSDIICVAAAGNDGTSETVWPAADENVIGVGALGEDWELAYYSNFGENIDLVAPGTAYTAQMGGSYRISTGTSLASPIVAGAVALLLQDNPYTTFEDVTQVLYASCCDLGDLGRDWDYGFGALDIGALILEERSEITFDMLTFEVENEHTVVITGHSVQELPEPERLYAVFQGWYYDDTFTEKYNYEKIYGDVTLYAKWGNEEDGIPYTYAELDDGTIEIRSYTGHRRYITIPDVIDGKVVSSIGEFAFYGEQNLRGVALPAGLTQVKRYAFMFCSNLTSIEIPAGVTAIDECAFSNNIALDTVRFADDSKLATIGDKAFAKCSSLETIYLPASLTAVNGSAFSGATKLHEIQVQSGNTAFTSMDGVLFDKSGSILIAFPADHGSSYAIPTGTEIIAQDAFAYAKLSQIDLSGIHTIGDYAFSFSALKSVTIPDSVVSLGNGAFQGAANLSAVSYGTGLTAIPDNCFSMCLNLKAISISDKIVSIGASAFTKSGVQEVVFGENPVLEVIYDSAFFYSQLSKFHVPASVKMLGNHAFSGTPLSSVTFPQQSSLQSIGSSVFSECYSLTAIELPAGLQVIGEQAFYRSGLTEVVIPAAVSSLGNGAFAMCSNLKAITVEQGNAVYHDLDGVVYDVENTTIHAYPAGKGESQYTLLSTTQIIAPYAFAGAHSLSGITLPESLTQIEEFAFYTCTGLLKVDIPDNVIQISRHAFAQDWNLTDISFGENSKISRFGYGSFANCGMERFRVPANISTMGQGVFAGCERLVNITFAAGSKLESISSYMFSGCNNLRGICFEQGSALTSIQAHGFEGLGKLDVIDFGDAKLEKVGNFAFSFCTNFSSVSLPATVTEIGRYAYYGCSGLNRMTVPSSVEYVGEYTFLGTNNLDVFFAAETLPAYLAENWDASIKAYYIGVTGIYENEQFKYGTHESGTVSIIQYLGSDAHLDLTQVDLGGSIVTIGGGAFEDTAITSIVLPDTLTQIQADAFRHTALESVTIPANVTFIGREAFAYTDIQTVTFAAGSKLSVLEQYAFRSAKKLTSVTLPASLTTLGTGAFMDSGLQSVTFEEGIGIEKIPQKAFAETKLTGVVLPDSINEVGDHAFANVQTLKSVSFGTSGDIRLKSNAFYHTGLESLHIPANVTYIGEYCFVALPNLSEFTVDENNPNYTAVDGLLLSKDQRKLISVPAGKTGSLTVPLTVEEIGFGAFEESKLSEIHFHADANILTIGYRAFFKAENITSFTVPKSVVSIDYYAFAYCSSLKEVIFDADSRLEGIYEGAFCGCHNLENIQLPDSIHEISDWAFYGCEKIDEIPVSATCGLEGIYDYAFAYSGLSGAFTTPESLTEIGDYAFMGNRFTSVTIPEANKKELVIGLGAFEDCDQIQQITLPFLGKSFENPEVSWIGYIFGAANSADNNTYMPESLKTVTLTDGLTTIYHAGFAWCENIEYIHIPSSVTVLLNDAFLHTTAVYQMDWPVMTYWEENGSKSPYAMAGHFGSGITGSVTLAEGVTEIGSSAFAQMKNLKAVNMPSTVETIHGGAFWGSTGLTHIVLPEKLTSLGERAFASCTELHTVVLPDSLEVIGESAFYKCYRLNEIEISAGVTQIGEDAFGSCTGLKKVRNNSELTLSIGSAENGCVAYYAQELIHKDGSTEYLDASTGFALIDTAEGFRFARENGAYTLLCYIGQEDNICLPSDINGEAYTLNGFSGGVHITLPEGMTALGDHAFKDNATVESVILPDSVQEIGKYAFYGCENLQKVEMSDGCKVIEEHAFEECVNLREITLPSSCEWIGEYAFANCDSLQSIAVPEGCIELQTSVFYHCDALEEAILPTTLAVWGNYLFTECVSLERVVLPEIKASIPQGCFQGCTGLKQIYIPEGFARIEYHAFEDCTSLENVVLPDTLYQLGGDVFTNCPSLKELYLPAGVSIIETGTFDRDLRLEIAQENAYFQLVDGILYDKPATRIIDVFSDVSSVVNILEGVAVIQMKAFADMPWITEVNLPESLRNIDGYAFENCTGLKEIHLPESMEAILDGAFMGCTALTSVDLPDSIADLGLNVFRDCTNLQSVHLPANIDSVPGGVFQNCIRLEQVEIPQQCESIGQSSFEGCISLQNLPLPETIEAIEAYAFCNCARLGSISIPDDVWFLGKYAFAGCASIREIRLPSGVSELPVGLLNDCQALETIHFPDTLTAIGINAINNCQSLRQITLPQSLKTIEAGAFVGCNSLVDVQNNSELVLSFDSFDHGAVTYEALVITDKNGEKTYRSGYEDFSYVDTQDGFRFMLAGGEYTLIAYIGGEENITLPTDINGNEYRIRYFRGGVHITVPDGITELGMCAFYGNSTVESITISDTVVTIKYGAFANCSSLQSVKLSKNLSVLEDSMFKDCISLTEIQIPEGITFVGSEAFYNCHNLQKVTLPDALIHTGAYVFYNCWSLTDIDIPDNVYRLYANMFDNSGIFDDPNRWIDGMFIVDGWLMIAPEDMVYLPDYEFRGAAYGAFYQCTDLREAIWEGGLVPYTVKTIWLNYLTDASSISILPQLENVIITGKCVPESNGSFEYLFQSVQGVTFYLEKTDDELRWDAVYPGWNYGNQVRYGDEWITVTFYDQNGNPIASDQRSITEVIRLPIFTAESDSQYRYTLVGWDTDSDGKRDRVPATSLIDMQVTAVTDTELQTYTVIFKDWDGTVYHEATYPFGSTIQRPADPTVGTKIFEGWLGYDETITVSGDMVFVAKWHRHSYAAQVTDPTCVDKGYTTYTCRCGDSYQDAYVDELGHTLESWYTVKQPTCVDKGEERRDCAQCDHYETREIDATGHNHTFEVTAPTCTEQGYTTYTCSCGDTYVADYTAPLDHSFTDYLSDGNATCAKDGTKTARCNRCTETDTMTDAGSMLPHNYSVWKQIEAPTCREKGTDEHTCVNCGYTETRSVAPTGHTFHAAVSDPTCTEQGYTTHTCHCGESYVDSYVDALGHSFGDWHQTKVPSCTEQGSEQRVCSRCSHSETQEIAAYGHSFSGYVSDGNATCTVDGTKTAQCDHGCGAKDTIADIGSAKGHHYTDAITSPTCTERGYTTHTCNTCGNSYTDSYVDAKGHSYGAWEQTKAPTCTGAGAENRSCVNCGHAESREIAAHGHSFTNYVSDNNATCTADGTKTALCDHGCGNTDTVADAGTAKGHSFGAWYVVNPATMEAEGLERRDCQNCDHFEEQRIPVLTGPGMVTSDEYQIEEGTVGKITAGTTAEEFLSGLNEAEYVKVFKNGTEVSDDTPIGTGMEIQLIVGDEVVQTLTVIVTGDTNGDGSISITDMLAAKAHVLKKSTLEGAYFKAGDTSDDGAITITDFIQMKAQILGKSDIVPHSAEPEPVVTTQAAVEDIVPVAEETAEVLIQRPMAAILPNPMKREYLF